MSTISVTTERIGITTRVIHQLHVRVIEAPITAFHPEESEFGRIVSTGSRSDEAAVEADTIYGDGEEDNCEEKKHKNRQEREHKSNCTRRMMIVAL